MNPQVVAAGNDPSNSVASKLANNTITIVGDPIVFPLQQNDLRGNCFSRPDLKPVEQSLMVGEVQSDPDRDIDVKPKITAFESGILKNAENTKRAQDLQNAEKTALQIYQSIADIKGPAEDECLTKIKLSSLTGSNSVSQSKVLELHQQNFQQPFPVKANVRENDVKLEVALLTEQNVQLKKQLDEAQRLLAHNQEVLKQSVVVIKKYSSERLSFKKQLQDMQEKLEVLSKKDVVPAVEKPIMVSTPAAAPAPMEVKTVTFALKRKRYSIGRWEEETQLKEDILKHTSKYFQPLEDKEGALKLLGWAWNRVILQNSEDIPLPQTSSTLQRAADTVVSRSTAFELWIAAALIVTQKSFNNLAAKEIFRYATNRCVGKDQWKRIRAQIFL